MVSPLKLFRGRIPRLQDITADLVAVKHMLQPPVLRVMATTDYRDSTSEADSRDLENDYEHRSSRDSIEDDVDHASEAAGVFNPYSPLPGVEQSSGRVLTVRAVILGSLCGVLVNAANVYIGLKTGWTFTANIFASIVGFAVLRKWSSWTAKDGVFFGPGENNIVQTVATAAAGMSSVFTSAIPALYQLNLLRTPGEDYMKLMVLTGIGGYFGVLAVVGMRQFFLVEVARDLNLIFPTALVTATTIRSMHLATDSNTDAHRAFTSLFSSFGAATLLTVVSQFALGILMDWHVFTWLKNLGLLDQFAVAAESWGWIIQWSPAMIGTGMLVPPNVAYSFLGGTTLAWGIIGPYLVSSGMAFGEPASVAVGWEALMSYSSMSTKFANATHPSPRFWLLWPGVLGTLSIAFFDSYLACQWRTFAAFTRSAVQYAISKLRRPWWQDWKYKYMGIEVDDHPNSSESSLPASKVPARYWAPQLVVLLVFACFFTNLAFQMSIPTTLLSLTLAFFMATVCIQATGATDTTPVSAVSKASQVLISNVSQASGASIHTAQRLSLLGGALTSTGSSQATDLMVDLKVGFLLGTPVLPQYFAQVIGTLVATIFVPSIFILFTTAYPCILDDHDGSNNNNTRIETCEFTGPSIAAWKAVAIVASEPTSPIPPSSKTFSLIFVALCALVVLFRHLLLVGRRVFLRSYIPNMMIIAIAFTLPSPQYGVSMAIGAAIAQIWRSKHPKSWNSYGLSFACGLVAGEGIGGTINCMLSILGFGGRKHGGTSVGCPAGRC
ncbi:oligopeptide transporter [Xylariaceae sp. AK1471]|nr:oligopeptide transporter [Xylariaceae sp. AK1471]